MGVIVRVDEAAISGLFDNTGGVGRWAGRVAEEARVIAGVLAPSRSGRLAASLQGNQVKYYTFGQRVSIRSSVPYAGYVEDGVDHPIVAHSPKGMWVPKIRGTTQPRMWRHTVAGQPGQHFMARGLEAAFGLHGVMVPMNRPVSSLY